MERREFSTKKIRGDLEVPSGGIVESGRQVGHIRKNH